MASTTSPSAATRPVPQWSPVLETGNGGWSGPGYHWMVDMPQWSPVLETGNGNLIRIYQTR